VAIALVALNHYKKGGVCHSKARLDGRTILITGANTGLGFQSSLDMARRGARVLLACRSVERCKAAVSRVRNETGNDQVAFYQLDLASLQSVKAAAAQILAKEKQLHILLNNAGVMAVPHSFTKEGFEMHFGVNHLGHFLLTKLLLPLIRRSQPARIINVSSLAHQSGTIKDMFEDLHFNKTKYSWMNAYANSKLANVLFSAELSRRLANTQITVNSLHPGAVVTELTRHFPQWLQSKHLADAMQMIALKTSIEGAQTQNCAAVDPTWERVSGLYFSDCWPKMPTEEAQDPEVAMRLWTESERLVGEKY